MLKIILIKKFFLISMVAMTSEFYNFYFESIEGKSIPLNIFKNKVLLLVNTASMCGFTKQYDDIVEILRSLRNQKCIFISKILNKLLFYFIFIIWVMI